MLDRQVSAEPAYPLASITVLEVGSHLAGPFCGMQLADLGAEVIKIEHPDGGDQTRHAAPLIQGEGSTFLRLNRNKRSLAVDLKTPEGKKAFKQLVNRADIVVENLRPGTMRDLGLDYANVLQALNPALIYVAISGWGQDGPLSNLAGLDIMAQARSGLMSITGTPGGDPVKVGVPVCDLVTGLYGALGAVSAIQQRALTGRGQLIDVSLYEAGVSLAVWEIGKYFATGEVPFPLGSAHQSSAPYQAFRAADGWFTLGATSLPNWRALCQVLGLERLIDDDRYGDASSRHDHRDSLIPEIEAVTIRRPVRYWIEHLEEVGVPCAPIQTYDQVFTDPHLQARNFYWDGAHPTAGKVRQLGSPIRLSEGRTRRDRAAPMFGEDSIAIMSELGYEPNQISDLRARNVVKSPDSV